MPTVRFNNNDEHIDIKEMTFDIANISSNSELSNKIIRGYIEALDLFSESKINAKTTNPLIA